MMILFVFQAAGQKERSLVRQGNKLYNKNQFLESEIKYKEAIDHNAALVEAGFNLGDAFYKQKKYEQAAPQFEIAANKMTDKKLKSLAYHNLGNTYLQMYKNDPNSQQSAQNLEKSIKAYKNALKNNPNDPDTKYNLTYALKLQKQMQGKKGKKNDKQDKNKEQDKKEEKQENKQNQQNQKKEQKPEKQELNKKEADQMLKALQNEEKKTQDKVLKSQQRPVRVKIEKDW